MKSTDAEGSSFGDELTPTQYKPWAEGQTSFYNPFEYTYYEEVEKEIEEEEKKNEGIKKTRALTNLQSACI